MHWFGGNWWTFECLQRRDQYRYQYRTIWFKPSSNSDIWVDLGRPLSTFVSSHDLTTCRSWFQAISGPSPVAKTYYTSEEEEMTRGLHPRKFPTKEGPCCLTEVSQSLCKRFGQYSLIECRIRWVWWQKSIDTLRYWCSASCVLMARFLSV